MSEKRKEVIDKLNELAPFVSLEYIMAIHNAICMLSEEDEEKRFDPEEIKKALKTHGGKTTGCRDCPYAHDGRSRPDCSYDLCSDALWYIEYLERQKGE